jgi:hypothetical protein
MWNEIGCTRQKRGKMANNRRTIEKIRPFTAMTQGAINENLLLRAGHLPNHGMEIRITFKAHRIIQNYFEL